MKVATIFNDGKAGLVEKPDLTPKADFAVVKVHAVPMCTEYKDFKAGRQGERFGHEAAGEVVEVAQPGQVEVGDRVVVQCGSGCGRCPMCLTGEVIHCQSGRRAGAVTGQQTFGTYSLTIRSQAGLVALTHSRRNQLRTRKLGVLWSGTNIRSDAADAGRCP